MNTTTKINIESLLPWSPAKRVNTKQGARNLRTASPTQAFWNVWRSGKDALKSAGVSVSQDRGAWQVCWWLPLDATEARVETAAQEASRATTSDFEPPCPEGKAFLPFQKAGIAFALERDNVLIADSMGLGKTVQAIGVFNADTTIKRILVVCPAGLRLNWKKEFSAWATRPINVSVVNGGKASDWDVVETPDAATVVVINYDVLGKHRARLDAVSWDLLVADEAHYAKNPKAARTTNLLGKVSKGKRISEGVRARRKVFLTGTPIVNRPVELWPIIEAIDPSDLGRNFFGFAKRYCAAHQTRFGWDFSGASNLEELQRRLRSKFMVRRLKEEVLTELPSKRRQVIEIPANGASDAVRKEKALYESHRAYIEYLEARIREAELESTYDLAQEDPELVAALRRQLSEAKRTAFTEMSAARHETALAKVPHVIEHVTDALETGPVILFAHHRDVIAQLADAFPGRVGVITGETKLEDRQRVVDDFQAGKVDLFVGNIIAAGTGITLTRSAHVVFAELDWVPGNMSQAEDRAHRIGQTESVLVQHLVLEGSLDAEMARKLIAKQEVIDKALDRRTESPEVTEAVTEIEVELKPDRVQEEAAKLTVEQVAAIHLGLRILAGACDGVQQLDGCGYNKLDASIGHKLAAQSSLSPKQALLGLKLVNKYRRQLGAELVAQAKGG